MLLRISFLAVITISCTLASNIHRTARHNGLDPAFEHIVDLTPPVVQKVTTQSNQSDTELPPVGEANPVDIKYLEAFRGFSQDLIEKPFFYQSLVKSGAVAYCPFTLGYILAAVNEKALDVSTEGISEALELSPGEITNAYAAIGNSFAEDVKVKSSSFLYTQDQNIQLSPAYKQLHTEKATLQLDGNSEAAASYINGQIAKCTRNAIVEKLVPKEPNFSNSTAGIYINTFYYKSPFDTPVLSIGKQPFNITPTESITTETLQTTGKLRVLTAPKYNAVSISLLGGRKRVVLVQPVGISLEDYISTYSKEIFKFTPRKWGRSQATVEFPALNLVLGRDFNQQINELAGARVQCNVNSESPNYIQPVVQVGSYKICPEGFELAVANGVQVNHLPPVVPLDDSIPDADPTVAEPEDLLKTARQIPAGEPDEVEEEPADLPPMTLKFDQPFFIYLHDNNLGPVSFAAVQSAFNSSAAQTVPEHGQPQPTSLPEVLAIYRHHLNPLDDAKCFSEVTKSERWSCGSCPEREPRCKFQAVQP